MICYLIKIYSTEFLNIMLRWGGKQNVCQSRKLKLVIKLGLNLTYVCKKEWLKNEKCHYILKENIIYFL